MDDSDLLYPTCAVCGAHCEDGICSDACQKRYYEAMEEFEELQGE